MKLDNLIRMANQIGTFFEAMPDRPQAVVDASDHLRRFWDPRMRLQLLAHVDEQGGAGLEPLALAAVRRLPMAEANEVHEGPAPGGDAG